MLSWTFTSFFNFQFELVQFDNTWWHLCFLSASFLRQWKYNLLCLFMIFYVIWLFIGHKYEIHVYLWFPLPSCPFQTYLYLSLSVYLSRFLLIQVFYLFTPRYNHSFSSNATVGILTCQITFFESSAHHFLNW